MFKMNTLFWKITSLLVNIFINKTNLTLIIELPQLIYWFL